MDSIALSENTTEETGSRERVRKRADKRMLIMRAAIELFRDSGYNGTRIIDIARRAGIGKGTVYDYFSCKEDLMLEIVRDIVLDDYRVFFNMGKGAEGLRNRLAAHVESTERMIKRYGLYAKIFAEQIVCSETVDSEPVMRVVNSMTEDQLTRIRTMIADASREAQASGREGLSQPEIEEKARLTNMIIYSYSMVLISNQNTKKEADFIVSRDGLVDYLISGIGLTE